MLEMTISSDKCVYNQLIKVTIKERLRNNFETECVASFLARSSPCETMNIMKSKRLKKWALEMLMTFK